MIIIFLFNFRCVCVLSLISFLQKGQDFYEGVRAGKMVMSFTSQKMSFMNHIFGEVKIDRSIHYVFP